MMDDSHRTLCVRIKEIFESRGYRMIIYEARIQLEGHGWRIDLWGLGPHGVTAIECGDVKDRFRIPMLLRNFEEVVHVHYNGELRKWLKGEVLYHFVADRKNGRCKVSMQPLDKRWQPDEQIW